MTKVRSARASCLAYQDSLSEAYHPFLGVAKQNGLYEIDRIFRKMALAVCGLDLGQRYAGRRSFVQATLNKLPLLTRRMISTLASSVKFEGRVEPDTLTDIAYLSASPDYLHRGPILRGHKLDLRQSARRGYIDSLPRRKVSPSQALVVHKYLTKDNLLDVKLITEPPYEDIDDRTAEQHRTNSVHRHQNHDNICAAWDHYDTEKPVVFVAPLTHTVLMYNPADYVDADAEVQLKALQQLRCSQLGLSELWLDPDDAAITGTLGILDRGASAERLVSKHHELAEYVSPWYVHDEAGIVCAYNEAMGADDALGEVAKILPYIFQLGHAQRTYVIPQEADSPDW